MNPKCEYCSNDATRTVEQPPGVLTSAKVRGMPDEVDICDENTCKRQAKKFGYRSKDE